MIIYRATKWNILSQGFGVENTSPKMLPEYKKICSTAHDGVKRCLEGHNGWDWPLKNGTRVYWDCDCDGKVKYVDDDEKGGRGVEIVSYDEKTGKHYKHIFWHFQGEAVRVGQTVTTGQLLGWGDNTGWSTGPHLHRGLKECDANGYTLNHDNGYLGAIDIKPFFVNIFARDLAAISLRVRIAEILAKVVLLSILLLQKQQNHGK